MEKNKTWKNRVIKVLLVIVPIVIGLLTLFYTIVPNTRQKKKDKIDLQVSIRGHILKQNEGSIVIFLIPTYLIMANEYQIELPLRIINNSQFNIENLIFDFQAPKGKKSDKDHFLKSKKIVESITGFENHHFYAPEEKKEIIRYEVAQINTNTGLSAPLVWRALAGRFFNESELETPVQDNLSVELVYSFKDKKDHTYKSFLNMILLNYNDLDGLIRSYEIHGSPPFSIGRWDKIKKKYTQHEKVIVIIPQYNHENKTLNFNNSEIKRIEYSSKNYYKKRRLSIYDENDNLIDKIKFPDLDKSVINGDAFIEEKLRESDRKGKFK